jgi:hypothetical protein
MMNHLINPQALSNHKMAVCPTRVSWAAALRLAMQSDYGEGINKHFTAAMPGREDP